MLTALLIALFWVLGTIGTLATFILCGWLGWWLAGKIAPPAWRWAGAAVGLVFHLPGCACLAAVWGLQWLCLGTAGREALRIDRAVALLQSYGYACTPPASAP